MQSHIRDSDGTPLIVLDKIPEYLRQYRYPDAVVMLYGNENAIMYFQVLQLEHCVVSFSVIRLTTPGRYYFDFPNPMLDLNIAWKGSFTMIHPQEGDICVPESSFNLRYWPALETIVDFDQVETIVISVGFTAGYFEKYVDYYPPIERFLRKVSGQIPVHLARFYSPLTHELRHVLKSMIFNEYTGKLKEFFLNAKTLELLNLSLRYMHLSEDAQILTPTDILRIRQAKDIIEFRMDDPPSLQELARELGTNDFLLKKHFKYYYRVTIFEYLLRYRMGKALSILQSTDEPLGLVAIKTGYNSLPAFSKAFKKFFGYSPSRSR
ncbi:MAG TPA: AraC family transcriptional regulator [Sediminibacterium sp.]|nr:AraC family transcriptional regulator [Sediminibacterium sp.]